MVKLSDLPLSKDMKYNALYTAMRFFEHTPNVFEKTYGNGIYIRIDSDNQEVSLNDEQSFLLETHESFVKLECINRLLSLGYNTKDFILCGSSNKLSFKGYKIKFLVWDDIFLLSTLQEREALYKSRLIGGILEYKTKICNGDLYDYGLFNKKDIICLQKQKSIKYDAPDFIIEENRVLKYIGTSPIVVVPNGIEKLDDSAFWDNQHIEEVILPDTLTIIGGDAFYNCKKLKKINISRNIALMGNNPFAGCPLLKIINYSDNFIYEHGALYTKDKERIIYCSICGTEKEFVIPEGVIVIGKHTFFLCDRFERITLPTTLKIMENNPFSGCKNLVEIINKSKSYYIQDNVIYNGFKTSVVGTLNKIKSKRLVLIDGIKTINRNSFWRCTGIETIVFPESLIDIGYNPFVECSNIRFESKSPYFKVVDDVLYNKDMSKIICYPAWKAIGFIHIPDSVTELERSAFSGCSGMTGINLHNTNTINRSCFTNCSSLLEVYCSDFITYIGEWAFAYCSTLKTVSIKKGTIVDRNVFSNCNAKLIERECNTNYLIESDNEFTLKSMRKAYNHKIDSILIDPPYNSHIDYIEYKDGDYTEGYLNFIAIRIKLSYDLLSEKGFLVINIDEGEIESLSKLCKDIFGETLVTVHKWKKLHEYFDVNRHVRTDKKIVRYEYIIICRKNKNAILKEIMQPYIEDGVLKERASEIPQIFDCFGTTSSAKDEIKDIFGTRDYFSTPKPLKLIKELIRATTESNSIIMDYFAGSGTVGHACQELNSEDGGNRTFILVCNSESNICENVTNKRLQEAKCEYVYLK